jgi:hypothetical protein
LEVLGYLQGLSCRLLLLLLAHLLVMLLLLAQQPSPA